MFSILQIKCYTKIIVIHYAAYIFKVWNKVTIYYSSSDIESIIIKIYSFVICLKISSKFLL